MQLSPEAKQINEFLPKWCAKIVAEFSGYDVDKHRNEHFLEVEKGGFTFCRFPNGDQTSLALGNNWRINRWKIIKRTPKSYWVQYDYSTIICCTGEYVIGQYSCYKYNTTIPNLIGREKRVFPFRRIRDKTQWEMKNELLKDEEKHVCENVIVDKIYGGFRLSFK